jgi:NTP pyrophosphatase (non-canonical NTP hydrolase)
MCDTKTYEAFVRSLMGSHMNERACYALGLAGEAGEVCGELLELRPGRLANPKLEKELGDVCWYAVALAAQFGIPVEQVWLMATETYCHGPAPHWFSLGATLARDAGAAVDRLKKHWGHKQELDLAKVASDLARVLADVIYIADQSGLTLHDIRSANVRKLSARFPQGRFSTKAANGYADKVDAVANTQRAVPRLSPSQLTGPAHVCGMYCEGQDGRCDMRSRPASRGIV